MGAFETRTLRRIVLKGEIMKRKQKTSEATFRIIVFTVLAVFSIIFVIMLGWTVLNSLKTKEDFNFYPLAFPKQLRFDNYSKVFGVLYIDVLKVGVGMIRYNFSSMFINSLIYAVGCTFFTIFPKAICGYVFAHYNFRMKKFLFNLAMVVMILPVTIRAFFPNSFSLGAAVSSAPSPKTVRGTAVKLKFIQILPYTSQTEALSFL